MKNWVIAQDEQKLEEIYTSHSNSSNVHVTDNYISLYLSTAGFAKGSSTYISSLTCMLRGTVCRVATLKVKAEEGKP